MTTQRDYLRLVKPGPEPFASVEDAWFWTMAALMARRDGKQPEDRTPRACDPDDVVKELDRIYRNRRITLEHARILRIYGERGVMPNVGRFPHEARDAALWTEAMDRLGAALRFKGWVR